MSYSCVTWLSVEVFLTSLNIVLIMLLMISYHVLPISWKILQSQVGSHC